MMEIGHYRIRGQIKDTKRYKIYAEAYYDHYRGKCIKLRIQERKTGDPIMNFAFKFTGIGSMGRYNHQEDHGFVAWIVPLRDLDGFLNSFHNFTYEKYHSFKMYLDKNKLMDLKVLAGI